MANYLFDPNDYNLHPGLWPVISDDVLYAAEVAAMVWTPGWAGDAEDGHLWWSDFQAKAMSDGDGAWREWKVEWPPGAAWDVGS